MNEPILLEVLEKLLEVSEIMIWITKILTMGQLRTTAWRSIQVCLDCHHFCLETTKVGICSGLSFFALGYNFEADSGDFFAYGFARDGFAWSSKEGKRY